MIKHLAKKFFSRKLECLGIKCVSLAVFIDKSFCKSKKTPWWKQQQQQKKSNANQTLFGIY